MKKKHYVKVIALCFTFLLLNLTVFAQLDSNAKNDSVNTNILNRYNKNLAEAETQRIQDSVKKVEVKTTHEGLVGGQA